jgi:putative flavoprotein involved in K+ transport
MTMPEVVQFLQRYADVSGAPVAAGTRVTRVRQTEEGYEVSTDQGSWRCRALVIASGACNIAAIPSLSAGLPHKVTSLTPLQYRNPGLLPYGGVMIVGASASGIQLAREIHASGRRVGETITASVKVEHVRDDKPICKLETIVRNADGETCVLGTATTYTMPLLQREISHAKDAA